MSYSTKEEVREMLKDDALNASSGTPSSKTLSSVRELVAPIIEGAIADADVEIDGYLAKRYAVPLSRPRRLSTSFQRTSRSITCFPGSASTRAPTKDSTQPLQRGDQVL